MSQLFHLSLNVANLEYSVGFYRLLFGCEPTKWFADYAKFELSEPPIVLALEPAKTSPGGTLNHFGIRVQDQAAIDAFAGRLTQVGVELQKLVAIECCYSRQNKIVFRDPDQNLVEIYTLEGDSANKAAPTPMEMKAPVAPTTTYEHMVGTEFPKSLARDLSEVRLRGTFNRQEAFDSIDDILRQAKESLATGGQLLIHLLVSNLKMQHAVPALPPPADQVKFVPTEAEIVEAVEHAGFGYLEVKRLSHSPVMQLGNVELRELLLHAKKIDECGDSRKRDVVYMGPFKKLEDDRGRVFPRGQRVAVAEEELQWLGEQGWLESFTVLNSESDTTCRADS